MQISVQFYHLQNAWLLFRENIRFSLSNDYKLCIGVTECCHVNDPVDCYVMLSYGDSRPNFLYNLFKKKQ